MTKPLPCHLERRVVPKVWGGRRLEELLGVTFDGDEPIGETWEIFDRPDGASAIRDGGGRTLHDLIQEDAAGWLGKRFAHADRFPLLLKFLDAREALSVQLHPCDADAPAGDAGKNEAWLMLDVGANGRIVRGLRAGADAEALRAAAQQEGVEGAQIDEVLHAFRPEVGDAVMVPAGTVHSIGPDIVLFEVQQNSDVTYRVYDWGRPRELHLDAAFAAFREADPAAIERVERRAPCEDGVGEWVIRHEDFTVRRLDPASPVQLDPAGSFKILTVLAGQATLGWRSGGDDPPLFAQRGDTILVPASLDRVFLSPIGRFEALWTAPGGDPDIA